MRNMVKKSLYIFGILIVALYSASSVSSSCKQDLLRRIRSQQPILITADTIESSVVKGEFGLPGNAVISLPEHGISGLRVVKKYGSFSKHLIIKLLDEYFVSSDVYSQHHIEAPLAPANEWHRYYYIYAEGSEGFSWDDYMIRYKLREFDTFAMHFRDAGFDMSGDVCDCDDGRVSQNILLRGGSGIPKSAMARLEEEARIYGKTDWELPATWVRIDFEGPSCPTNYQTLEGFLQENKASLEEHLGWKFRLLELAFLDETAGFNSSGIKELGPSEREEFNLLLARYQREILDNLGN